MISQGGFLATCHFPMATISHKPLPDILGKEGAVCSLDSQLKPDIFNHMTVTESMGNRFYLSVAQRTGGV